MSLLDKLNIKPTDKVVKVGASLSLQSHQHRSEHWVVVQGTAKVTVGDDVQLLSENESIYVPLGAVHRLENSGICWSFSLMMICAPGESTVPAGKVKLIPPLKLTPSRLRGASSLILSNSINSVPPPSAG